MLFNIASCEYKMLRHHWCPTREETDRERLRKEQRSQFRTRLCQCNNALSRLIPFGECLCCFSVSEEEGGNSSVTLPVGCALLPVQEPLLGKEALLAEVAVECGQHDQGDPHNQDH